MPISKTNRVAKRVLDLVAAVAILLFSSPFLILVAIAIKFTSPGPVFFRQERLGKFQRKFQILKFRTMTWNAPDLRNPDGSTFNAEDDPRVTSAGRFLRKTSFDELPQLWNVLCGEMSLVGPRPELPDGVDTYLPGQCKRLDVQPGMTGWAVIHGRNNVPVSERRDLDAWYADHASFWLDVKIMAKTAVLVMQSRGIHRSAGPAPANVPANPALEGRPCSTES